MDADQISKLVELADSLVYEKKGEHLEDVEKYILEQTLREKKNSALHFEKYTDDYVRRGCGPKLWKRLSEVLGEKVHKRTISKVLQRIQSQQTQSGFATQSQCTANARIELNGHAALNGLEPIQFHQLTPDMEVSSCTKIDCISCQNSNRLNSCQACSTRLPRNGQMRELSQAEHPESEKAENCSADSTEQEFQSSTQTSQSENPNEARSGTYGFPTSIKFINFTNLLKQGVPLLLSVGTIGSWFALSCLVNNWYGVKNHLAGRLPKAQLGYKMALKLNPWSAAAHYNMGSAYEDEQNYVQAHDEYQKAIEGGIVPAYNNQARLYILSGKYDAAVALLRIGLPLAKDEDDRVKYSMLKNLGWSRLEQGYLEEAKINLQDAIQLKSDSSPAYCVLAQVLERKGEKKDALGEWENCLRFGYQAQTPEEDKWERVAQQRLVAAEKGKK